MDTLTSDPTSLFLRRALWTALRLTIVPVALSSAACGGQEIDETTGDAIDADGFAKVSCDPIHDLMPVQQVDYVSLRYAEDLGGGERRIKVLSERGAPCEEALEPEACLAEVASTEGLVENNIGVDHFVTLYVTTTRGDEVNRYDTRARLATWLGDIDTPDEAVLMARLEDYGFDCGDKKNGAVAKAKDGFSLIGTELVSSCPVEVDRVLLEMSRGGQIRVADRELASSSNLCIGRRPAGLRERSLLAERSLGTFFARVAHLEAASVQAFRQLGRALKAHGAPAALVHRARQAARDEIRHARETRRLARRFGGSYESPVIEPKPLPSLAEMARENAVEGAVRETFGALFGMFQATQAADLEVRQTMSRIAADETRHASLALDIACWIEPLVSMAERAGLAAAQRSALAELERELADMPVDESLRVLAGVPTADEARTLLAHLRSELWPHARAA